MGAFLLAARSVTQTITPNSGVPGRDSRPAVTLGVAHRCVWRLAGFGSWVSGRASACLSPCFPCPCLPGLPPKPPFRRPSPPRSASAIPTDFDTSSDTTQQVGEEAQLLCCPRGLTPHLLEALCCHWLRRPDS